jgi:5-formyltetrahydrofolate cyclo-ligase
LESGQWQGCDLVLAYMSLPREVQTDAIIEEALHCRKRVFLPRVNGATLAFHEITSLADAAVLHDYGMREPRSDLPLFSLPQAAGRRALILVPGLAFDRNKNRLGRGKGFFDGFLRSILAGKERSNFDFIGIGFQLQLVECVPVTDRDVPLDAIVTEEEWIG